MNKESDSNTPQRIVFFFWLWLQDQNQQRICGWNIQGDHWWVSKYKLSWQHRPRTVPNSETGWIPCSIGIRNKVTVDYTKIKPLQNSKWSLQRKQGLLSVLLNSAKQSPLQSTFQLWWTVLFDYESSIYEWNAIRKIRYWK